MPDDAGRLSVFLPGALKNYANGRVHWRTEAAYRKRWRTAVSLVARSHGWHDQAAPEAPKLVQLMASTFNLFDDDGLRNACKPLVDGLVDAGVLHSDAPQSGHRITYGQRIDRTHRGVQITVEAR
jgi:hypothetical protein